MNTKHKAVLVCTLAYIYIPVAIFLIGFVKLYFSIPVLFILGYFLCRMFLAYQKTREESEGTLIRIPVIVTVVIILALFCVCIGWGGWFPQAGDWCKHNAVLHDLSERSWPVYYTELETSMLTYYIGQYLVPALMGKITGFFSVAETTMFIWGLMGLCLVYINLVRILKADKIKTQMLTLLIMCFFSGAVILAQTVLHSVYPDMTFAPEDRHWVIVRDILLQYRSNFVMLRWVFPQCIVPWLTMLLFMEYRRKCEYYVLLFLPSMLFASFSFVSLCFYAVCNVIYLAIRQKKTNVFLRCLSLSNISPAVGLGGILFFYFWGYIKVDKPDYLSFQLQNYGLRYIFVYFVFCFFLFGIYALAVFKENRRNPVFYISVLILASIPLFKMGLCNDWVMSVSIPALFALMVYVLEFLIRKQESEWNGIKKGFVIICLLIGAWYPFCELKEGIAGKITNGVVPCDYNTLAYFSSRWNQDLTDDLKYNYYSYDLEGNIFYNYIARKQAGGN